jgi:endonuclease/exonuclease/phosphatase family metal-dependent hydrolase
VTPRTLRFLTLNLWGENGPWSERLALAADGLAALDPDVVLLQEVREVPGLIPNQAETLARGRGFHHVFAPSTAWGGGHEGLAILSRFPIGEHEAKPLPHSTETEGRIVLSARLDGGAGGLWVHTTHLSFREHEGVKREEQVQFVDEVITAHKNDNVQVLGGDFNAGPENDEIRWLVGATTLGGRRVAYQDAWDRLHPGERGVTWAAANPYLKTMSWLRADRRLDYLFVTPMRRDGRGRVASAEIVLREPREIPGREPVYASDHFGVVADVQVAPDAPPAKVVA